MCGVAGLIGKSQDQQFSYEILTALFTESQIRGTDAAGCWGTSAAGDKIVYHKEPIKSSEFVKKSLWKSLEKDVDFDLALVHARGASQGVGSPHFNKNNHPFVSADRHVGLIHNGRIHDSEYSELVKKYEVESTCDSEILLRLFENPTPGIIDKDLTEHINTRLSGLQQIWSFVDRGHMAVAIGERIDDDQRCLFLFRNKHRTIWLADLRKSLGQIFFCSTQEIWSSAMKNSGLEKYLKQRTKLVSLPEEEIWVLTIGKDEPVVNTILKYQVTRNGKKVSWKPEGDKHPIMKKSIVDNKIQIITKLDKTDAVITPEPPPPAKTVVPTQTTTPVYQNQPHHHRHKHHHHNRTTDSVKKLTDDEYEALYGVNATEEGWRMATDESDRVLGLDNFATQENIADFSQHCSNIRESLAVLEAAIQKKVLEMDMSRSEYKELITSMEQTDLDLEATVRMWMKNSYEIQRNNCRTDCM